MASRFFGEFMGTMVLILMGNGSVANMLLKRSKAEGAGWLAITTGWAFAVMTGVFTAIACGSPDAHINPAVTLAFAVKTGDFSLLAPFAAAQLLGAMAGAVLEATALQTREVVEAMEKDSGILLDVLRTDGGMVSNDLLMQFQADILDRPVVRPAVQETTALGAAYAAGLAVGFFAGFDDLRARWSVDHTWKPQMEADRRQELYGFWKKAVTRSFDWL